MDEKLEKSHAEYSAMSGKELCIHLEKLHLAKTNHSWPKIIESEIELCISYLEAKAKAGDEHAQNCGFKKQLNLSLQKQTCTAL